MNYPENLLYTKDHEWIQIEGGTCKIGITDFAQGELGDIVFMEMLEVGDSLKTGDSAGTIEAVKTVADVYSPINGSISQINDKLIDTPELINSDPYGEGWIIVLDINDDIGNYSFLSAEEYKEFIG